MAGMIQKQAYPHEETVKAEGRSTYVYRVPEGTPDAKMVTVDKGRHVIYSEEGRAVMDFWEAASTGASLVGYVTEATEEEKAEERGMNEVPSEDSIRNDLFLYVTRIGDGMIKAVRSAVGKIYDMDFDFDAFRREISAVTGTHHNQTSGLAHDILKLAAVVAYEDLCFEEGCFAGFDRADVLLRTAIPAEVSRYFTMKTGEGDVIGEAKTLFMNVHPLASEMCEQCITDRKTLIDAQRKESSRKAVAFEESLPEELRGTVKELKKVSCRIGEAIKHPFNMKNDVAEPVRIRAGNTYVTYAPSHVSPWPKPSAEELPILEKREQKLKTELNLQLRKHGIKGTMWPIMEPPSYINVEELDNEKLEMLRKAKEKHGSE